MNELVESANPDLDWQELRPVLDDAMHDLSAADREAVLLRYPGTSDPTSQRLAQYVWTQFRWPRRHDSTGRSD